MLRENGENGRRRRKEEEAGKDRIPIPAKLCHVK